MAGNLPETTLTYERVLDFAQEGGFDYAGLVRSAGLLDSSGRRLRTLRVDFGRTEPPEDPGQARAFWIDAYNGSAIAGVANHFPVSSVTKIGGYFSGPSYLFAGEHLSLDDIEKRKLFGAAGDARVHFAIVCASAGCPPLHPRAFSAVGVLDALLDSLTAAVVNDTAYVALDFARGEARLSRLFDWYGEDFAAAAGSVIGFIAARHHRGRELPTRSWKVSYRDYDWSLNLPHR